MKKSAVIPVWGLITAVSCCLYSLALALSGNTSNRSLSYVTFLIMFAGMLIGVIQYRKANGGYGSFGQLYKVAILITLIVAVISTIYLIVFMQVNPGFMDKIREQAQADMVNKGYSAEQIEMGMKMMNTFLSPGAMIIYGLLGNLFFGALLGLLAAGISVKPKPFNEEDNNTLPS